MKIELYEHQKELVDRGLPILQKLKILYLAAEVRTGKTLTSLEIADRYGAKKVLFLTKKRAIPSIEGDYSLLNPKFEITIINNESLHKVLDDDYDLLISDEHHRNGSFPKPNQTTKEIKRRFGHLPMIFLSGTPAIESGSQWYHQFWVSNYSPFNGYRNFYGWAKRFTTPAIKYLGSFQAKDYSKAIDSEIKPLIAPYVVTVTQKEAGFKSEISENVIYYTPSATITTLVQRLLKDLVLVGKEETILADSASKLMSKIHQLENGTIIFDSGVSKILDKTKAEFIKARFEGKKLALFYNFKKEYDLLKEVFGEDNITNELDVFNTTNKHIALQQVSGSEGISLKAADVLVYYNYGYSGKNYVQSKDRMTTKDREENDVYFVFAKKSLNERIYKAIKNKKRYNDKIFIREYKLKSLFNNDGERTRFTD